MKVIMHKDKETRNAIRYAEPRKEGDPHNKNIYLTKEELMAEFKGIPEALVVTLEPEK